jgi:protein-disulfide isomerase
MTTSLPNPPPGAGPREQRSTRAKRVAAERAAAEARQRRRRAAWATTAALVVLALVVGLGIAVQASRDSSDASAAVPAGLVDGAVQVGGAAPVTVEVYEDFLCPACREAEELLGPTLSSLAEEGTISLAYRPMAFLDRASSDRYSTRALNAVACAVDSTPESFPALHASLFAAQPAEGGAGLSDARLSELAAQAGAGDQSQCIADLRFEEWTRRMTDQASRDGVVGTPTYVVAGTPLTERTPEALRTAVQQARTSD